MKRESVGRIKEDLMETTETITNEAIPDRAFRGYRFFSRPVFYSVPFTILTVIAIGTVGFWAYLLASDWDRIPSYIATQLLLATFGGVVAPWWWAISYHGKIYELFLVKKLQAERLDDTNNTVLDAAATMILFALFLTSTSILMLLSVIGHFARLKS
jgi:hypothetical protein